MARKGFTLIELLVVIAIIAILAAILSWQASAAAVIVTYSDKTTFLADTGAVNATGPLPNLGFIPGSVQTVGGITFSISPPSSGLFIGAAGAGGVPGGDWTALHPGNEIAISDVENLNAQLGDPAYAVGFDFVEPNVPAECFAPCFDSTFTVTLKSGAVVVNSFTFNAPDQVLAFVGVWSTSAFDRVEIRDTTATIDDEFFGEFYTGTTPLRSAVPEPSTLLIASGLVGVAGVTWNRQRRK
jgi:prepilin-type N-terminal cleavage/methylation domain-containing protein